MLRKICVTKLLLLLAIFVTANLWAQGRSYTLFVFPFETEGTKKNSRAKNFRKGLIKAIEESGRFDLVEESDYKDAIKELRKAKKLKNKIKPDEPMPEETMLELAKIMGVKVAITGVIGVKEGRLFTRPEFIDTENGEKLSGQEVSVNSDGDVKGLVTEVTGYFFKQIDIDRSTVFGRDYFNSHLYDKALENFQKALALAPDRADILYWIGNTHVELKDQTKAIESYKKTITLDPEYVNAYYRLGRVYYDAKDWNNAIANFETASGLKPEDASIYGLWGNSLVETGKVTEGVEVYKKGFDSADGDVAGLYNSAAIALYNNDRFAEAIPYFQKYLNTKSDDAVIWQYLAASEQKVGNFQGVIDAYEKVVAISPCTPNAYKNLGIFHSQKFKNHSAAVESFDKALECTNLSDEQRGEIHLAKGNALNGSKRFSNALSSLQQAESLIPNSHGSYYRVFAIKGEALKDWGDQRQSEDTLPGYETSISLYRRAIAAFRLALNDNTFKKFAGKNMTYCTKQIERSQLLVKQKKIERRERAGG